MMSKFRTTFKSLYEDSLKEEQLVLKEGLIKSFPILNFKLAILHSFREDLIHIGIIKSFNIDTSLLIVLKNEKHLEDIKKFANTYGYHLAFTKDVVHKEKNYKSYQFDPKYPTIVPSKYLPHFAYHVTSNRSLNNILKIGLTPKNSKTAFEHPGNRIYLLFSNSKEGIVAFKNTIKQHLSNKGEKNVALSVLKVNINKDVVHYFDPNFEPYAVHKDCFGVFVLRNIHPAYVELLPELSDNRDVSSKDEEYHKNLKK